MSSNSRYNPRVVDTKTFPGAMAMLLYQGVIRGSLQYGRAEAALIFVSALVVIPAVLVIAPLQWVWDRLRG